MKRVDLGVAATGLIALSSFMPWVDATWISTGCSEAPGALGTIGIVGWLVGVGLLVVSLATARGQRRLWRDLLLLPALVATLVGFVLVFGAPGAESCGNGFLG